MERQLQSLQAEIESRKAQKKFAKEQKRAAERIPKPPKPSTSKKVASGSGGGGSGGEFRQRASTSSSAHRKRPSGGNGNKKSGKKARKHDSSDDDDDDDDMMPAHQPATGEVSFEMKRELAVKIVSFEGQNLERAIDIIRQGRPDLLSVRFSPETSLSMSKTDLAPFAFRTSTKRLSSTSTSLTSAPSSLSTGSSAPVPQLASHRRRPIGARRREARSGRISTRSRRASESRRSRSACVSLREVPSPSSPTAGGTAPPPTMTRPAAHRAAARRAAPPTAMMRTEEMLPIPSPLSLSFPIKMLQPPFVPSSSFVYYIAPTSRSSPHH